jgi:hypothetical protein
MNCMKKSEIILGIFAKLHPSKPEKQVLYELTTALADESADLNEWNETIPHGIAHAIVKNIGSARRKLTMEDVLRDIDIIVRRSFRAC